MKPNPVKSQVPLCSLLANSVEESTVSVCKFLCWLFLVFLKLLIFCLLSPSLVPFQLVSQEAGIRDLASVPSKAMAPRGTQVYLVSAVLSLSTAEGPYLDQFPLKTAGVTLQVKHPSGSWNIRGRGVSVSRRVSAQPGSEGRQTLRAPVNPLSIPCPSLVHLLPISCPMALQWARGAPDAVPIPALQLSSASVLRKAEAGPAQCEVTMHILKHISFSADVFIQR